jgi:hypothetical protein
MALEIFTGPLIPRELSTAAMEFLWAKWKTLHATGDLSLQRLVEESSYPLRPNCVYLLTTGDDFVYAYVGEAIQKATGHNRAGTLLSQSNNPRVCGGLSQGSRPDGAGLPALYVSSQPERQSVASPRAPGPDRRGSHHDRGLF